MIFVGIALLFSLILCGVALRANARFRGVARIPMQWSLNGQVTWSAPRAVALAFFPALAACMFVAIAFLSMNVRPRPGQEGLQLPVFIAIGVMWLAIQLFHLWMADGTLRRDGR